MKKEIQKFLSFYKQIEGVGFETLLLRDSEILLAVTQNGAVRGAVASKILPSYFLQ